MAAQQNTNRIQTTHSGSLPRPKDLLDLLKAKYSGGASDHSALERRLTSAVAEMVAKQVETGVDIVADGEMSKPGFFTYVSERLSGFQARPDRKHKLFAAEMAAFPEYYEQYFRQAMLGGTVAPIVPLVCNGPVSYVGQTHLQRDIANLKAATAGAKVTGVFMPATAPSGVGYNEYYKTEEEYINAVGSAMRVEYQAILDAGFLLQIDDPFLSDIFADPDLDTAGKNRRAGMYVDSINNAIKGLPAERIRFHTCYGINEGPRIFEASLAEVAPHMFRINAGSFSFEAANARHEHEYHLFETFKIPKDTVLIPGVITHASNIVEHPELIAERIVRFAKLVGRENVVPGGDCGFSSQATYNTEVHPTVVWAKFKAMTEGAQIATKQLWG